MNSKYEPSSEQIFKEPSNRFHPDAWTRFKKNLFQELEFVDVIPDKGNSLWNPSLYWKNKEDTLVFILNLESRLGKIDPMAIASMMTDLRPDEFNFEALDNDRYLIRMWWD